jgi:3-dehydroquinate synthase
VLGGGTLTDLAGFVGAVYMRGIPCVYCPTTTLAMCDAALGGKNGVDHDSLKNQLGAIRQPDLVLADTDWLQSLPDEQFREGLVEVVKMAAVLSLENFVRLEELAPALADREPAATLEAIEMAVAMKMQVVLADEREADLRRTLNFGHTIGHAIESLSGETVRHGSAVAMGLIAECRATADLVPGEVVGRIAALLARIGVSTTIPPQWANAGLLWQIAMRDKKARRGRVPMIVPPVLGQHATTELTEAGLARALA